MGTSLYERTTRHVWLTSSGEASLEPCGRFRCRSTVLGGSPGRRSKARIRVGFGGTTGYSILSLLAQEIARFHPGFSLELHPRTYIGEAAMALRVEAMDLAIVSPPAPTEKDVQVIRGERIIVTMLSDHELAGGAGWPAGEVPYVVRQAARGRRRRVHWGAGMAPQQLIDGAGPGVEDCTGARPGMNSQLNDSRRRQFIGARPCL